MLRRTAVVLLSLTPLAATFGSENPRLFVSPDDPSLGVHPRELLESRRLVVPLPSGEIELDLRAVSMRGPASFSFVGTVPGAPMLHAMVTVEGPALRAVVTHPDLGSWAYTHTDAHGGDLTEIEPPTVPRCGCDCETHMGELKRPQAAHKDQAVLNAVEASISSAVSANARGFELCRDSAPQIDVLVVYTPEALAQAGDVATMDATIQMGIDEFNLASDNSVSSAGTVRPQLRLVHAQQTAEPQGTTASEFLLDRIQQTDDGFFDDVHGLRDFYKADIVLLMTGAIDVCGRAYISVLPGATGREDLAFGVVSYNCTNAPVYAFAHEVGHILGGLHQLAEDYCDTGGREYAHGYVAPDESFSTIMATLTPAPTAPYFSTAGIEFMGQPVGAGQEQNMLAFNVGSALEVGRYRLSDCNGNNFCDDRELELAMLDDLDMNGTPDICQRDEDTNGMVDALEIMDNAALDLDADGMLDSVELPVRYIDQNATGLGTGLSWADAHTSIHDAFDAVERSGGDITDVWVAAGTYKPTTSGEKRAAAFFVPADTNFMGGFAGTETHPDQRDVDANQTILSGDLVGQDSSVLPFAGYGDNSLTIIRLSSVTNVLIDGFTIYGASGDTNANCGVFALGGGLFAFESEFTIRNCTFYRNRAWRGGAMNTQNDSFGLIDDCDILENNVVPVLFNPAEGDIFTSEGSGGGAYLTHNDAGNSTVLNSRFIGNFETAIVNIAGEPLIIGTVVANNTARRTAGISNASTKGSDATIINCTVVDNTASENTLGVGISNFRSEDVRIINSIVFGNRDTTGSTSELRQINNTGGSFVTLTNSIVDGHSGFLSGYSLTNVSAMDPLFVDAVNGDYTLDAMSPAIDAGDTSALDASGVTTDAAGLDRFVDDPAVMDTGTPSITDPMRPIVDIGALERQPTNSCVADFDGDGDVDLTDFGTFGAAFGSSTGDANYNADADFDDDGDVDLTDFGSFGSEFGTTDC